MSVTVLVTCFNEGAYIEQALQSVLDQTAVDAIDRIHVLDDGSADATRGILSRLKSLDPRIEVHLYENAGVATTRNRGVELVETELVAFLDGDDYWAPEKLQLQLALMESNPTVLLTYSGYTGFLDGRPTRARPVSVLDLDGEPDPTKRYFLDGPSIFPSTVLARTRAIRALGEGFVSECTPFEDFELFFRVLLKGRLKAIRSPLIHKRYRSGSLSSRSAGLMMRHALTAFRAARACPRLLPLAPRRIGERARRLALVHLYAAEFEEARRLASLAVRLDPFGLLAWATFALCFGGGFSLALLKRFAASRIELHLY